jgi:hypothetical protein
VRLFESEAEWLGHERWSHNLVWSCDDFDHTPETFLDAKSLKEHMETFHPEAATHMSLDRLADMYARPSGTVFLRSPFCDYQEQATASTRQEGQESCSLFADLKDTMEKHILRHLTSMFLMALPHRDHFEQNLTIRPKSQTISPSEQVVDEHPDSKSLPGHGSFSSKEDHNLEVAETKNEMWSYIKSRPYSGRDSFGKLATFERQSLSEVLYHLVRRMLESVQPISAH